MNPPADWLAAAELPQRWAAAARFVLLDTDFARGERFMACWRAWREAGGSARPPGARLHVLCVAPMLPALEDVVAACPTSTPADMLAQLRREWPVATPDVHALHFDDASVQLLLASGSLRERLPQWVARVDTFFIDPGSLHTAAAADAAWPLRLFRAAARLAAPDARLVLCDADEACAKALRSAGFVPGAGEPAPAGGLHAARHAPAFAPRTAAARHQPAAERHAVVIGGGLAGCATAWALAEQGWQSTVLDRHARAASEASGNPAGLFHGIVNAHDGHHARFNRAAALRAQREVAVALSAHGVAGGVTGLLRLASATADAAAMRAQIQALGLPPGYVRAVDAEQASALAGIAIDRPGWHYPGGGWVDPAGLARAFLERAGARLQWRGGADVAAVRRSADGHWEVFDDHGRLLARAARIVFAHAGDAADLCADAAPLGLPMLRVRGQLSVIAAAQQPTALPGLQLPRMPIASGAYLLPAVNGAAVFGATAQAGDADPAVRTADQRHNLAGLSRLTGLHFPEPGGAWSGRTAWRSVCDDRLPLVGPVPAKGVSAERLHAVPRLAGLYVFSGLGSRGITWAALGAQLVAAMVCDAPLPLGSGLVDALDPARFALRLLRRGPRPQAAD